MVPSPEAPSDMSEASSKPSGHSEGVHTSSWPLPPVGALGDNALQVIPAGDPEQIHAGADDVVHVQQRRWCGPSRSPAVAACAPATAGRAVVTPVQLQQVERVEMLWASLAHQIGKLRLAVRAAGTGAIDSRCRPATWMAWLSGFRCTLN